MRMWDNPHMNLDYLRGQLLERMKARRITAKRLSLAAGRGETYVRDLLQARSHNPTLEGLQRMAEVLGCTVAELTGEAATGFGELAQAPFVMIQADEADRFAEVNARVEDLLREEQMPHDRRTVARLSLEVWRDIQAIRGLLPFDERMEQALAERRSIVRNARTALFLRRP
jgi:transcriptional regulator with XRE-family HTH domain